MGHTEVVRVLLQDGGADIATRAHGLRAVEMARAAGHAATVALLEDFEVRYANGQAALLLSRLCR